MTEVPRMSSQASVSPLTRPTPRRLQGGRVGMFEHALIFIAVLSGLIGVIMIAVGAGPSGSLFEVVEFIALFWIWVAAGICAWWRRPTNGIGGLLLVGAVSILLVSTGSLGAPGLMALHSVFSSSTLAVAVHLLLAFPSGRVHGRLPVITLVLAYVTCIVFDSARTMAVDTPLFSALSLAQTCIGLAVMIMTAFVLVRRLRAADVAHRRVLLPLFAYGIITVIALPMVPNILFPMGAPPILIISLQILLMAGLPVAFLLGAILGSFPSTTPLEALSDPSNPVRRAAEELAIAIDRERMVVRAIRDTTAVGRLTPRQLEVLGLMAEGRSNAAIAAKLVLTEKAVVQHTSNIYDVLGLPLDADDHRRVLAVVRHLQNAVPPAR